ncbi:MAG: DUF5615 family PIN-like protein [Limisphaerales bacterium]
MKVLLDECCPAPIKKAIKGLEILTVEEAGLKGLANGTLLSAIEGKFAVLITADKNLRYQQNLTNRQVAIIELPTNSWLEIKALIPVLQATIARAQPGDYLIIPPHPTVFRK